MLQNKATGFRIQHTALIALISFIFLLYLCEYLPLTKVSPQMNKGIRKKKIRVEEVVKRRGGRWSISAYRTRHTFSPQHSLSKQGKNCLLFSKARLSLMSYLFPWNFPSQNLGMQSTPFLTPPNSALLRK